MKLFAYGVRPYDELALFQKLAQEYGFEFGYTQEHLTEATLEYCRGYSQISCLVKPIKQALIRALKEQGVKGLATRTIGYDHIDLESARKHGIRIAHAAYPPDGVANYAIMLMMMALRRTCFSYRQTQAQNFSLPGNMGRDISSVTVGVVGTGSIGATVIHNLSAFGSNILAYDPFPESAITQYAELVSFEDLLQRSDVITLHAPATHENYHMFNEETFAQMKPDAIIVNTARGSLIDTEALISALEQKRLGGAALDTLEHELEIIYTDRSQDILSQRNRAILAAFPNVIITPHLAFYTQENVDCMVRSTTEALLAFEHNNDTPYEVNE